MKPVARQFSFIGHPARILLGRALEFVHGIEKIEMIYFDQTTASLDGATGELENQEWVIKPTSVDLVAKNGLINKERDTKKSDFEWFETSALPYNSSEKNNKVRTLFNETDMLVLLVRIPNYFDGQKDLLFLFFDKHMKHYGLNKGDKVLSASIKTILEKSFVKLLIRMTEEMYSDQEILASISEKLTSNGKSIEFLTNRFREAEQKSELMIEVAARQLLEKYGEMYNRTYFFTDGAISQIRKFKGNFILLEDVIKSGVELVNNLLIIEPKSALPVCEYHLTLNVETEVEKERTGVLDQGRFVLAIKYLDGLENAAKSVKMKNLALTSDNVAKAHDRPKKPSAITYSAKYHRDKIIYLLKNYPDRWPTIRNDFKPLRNIVEKDPDKLPGKSKTAG